MWCCFDLIKTKGEGLKTKIVGWVRQSETQHKYDVRFDGFRSLSTHPAGLRGFARVPKLQLGNLPYGEAPASRDRKLELPVLNSPAGAWELEIF
jgi:hypothetical protein